jgi:hypothetical protein
LLGGGRSSKHVEADNLSGEVVDDGGHVPAEGPELRPGERRVGASEPLGVGHDSDVDVPNVGAASSVPVVVVDGARTSL